jgi:hypothetical protein
MHTVARTVYLNRARICKHFKEPSSPSLEGSITGLFKGLQIYALLLAAK